MPLSAEELDKRGNGCLCAEFLCLHFLYNQANYSRKLLFVVNY